MEIDVKGKGVYMGKTPDNILSERILSSINNHDFLTKKIKEKIENGYKKGTISPEEWKLFFEMNIKKESEDE